MYDREKEPCCQRGVVFDSDWKYFWLSQLVEEGATAIQWAEAKDGTKHTAMHRTAPTAENCPVANVSGAEVRVLR